MPKGKKATRDRRPGRRALASPEVIKKHDKIIKAEIRKEEDLKEQLDAQRTVIAERCFDAMEDGVETNHIGENLLKLSRQMLYKLVRERVFGKDPSGKPVKQPSKPGIKKGAKKTAKVSGKKKTEGKAVGFKKVKGKTKRKARRPVKRKAS